jgi:glycosyltransferase involved in cell wall biosynthesis
MRQFPENTKKPHTQPIVTLPHKFRTFTLIYEIIIQVMLNGKTIAVVVPAYNEEAQIGMVLETMPAFVDRIVVVNDCSVDRTAEIVTTHIEKAGKDGQPIPEQSFAGADLRYNRANTILREQSISEKKFFTPCEVVNDDADHDKIILINHLKNGGVGASIATGYKWCKDRDIDCTAVMAGDGQMDPAELEMICSPVVEEGIDYVKGNRLIHRSAALAIPRTRYFGNSVLSILTKIASGYWHVSDTQTGYTAISNRALNSILLYKIYPDYGMPNDMLVKLNIAFCTLKEVEIKPVYFIGERSKMKVWKVIPRISWLLLLSFFKRLYQKYLFRDFHPLFLLYHTAFILGIIAVPYGIKILNLVAHSQEANPITILAFVFLVISSLQSLLFAMWMDIQDNERLYKN